jgi:tRNA A37 threonylcarbamoyladenosine synthetase subunit TsaC/SUA5/YrdC
VPDAPVVRAIAALVGPLACTSANRHGEPTPASAAEAAIALGPGVAAVVEGGALAGEPSTVVALLDDGPRILRQGALPAATIEAVLRDG